MFSRFFGPDPRKQEMDALHARVVAASRAPVLYLEAHVPDTVEGRFECLSLHAMLLLRRLRELGEAGEAVAQEYVDCLFRHLDIALRELGVGDLSVGKRIKKLARSFYARVASYDGALSAADSKRALAEELARNVLGGQGDGEPLAAYVAACVVHLEKLDLDDIMTGATLFPEMKSGQAEPEH